MFLLWNLYMDLSTYSTLDNGFNFFLFFLDSVCLCSPGWSETCYVYQADLKLIVCI